MKRSNAALALVLVGALMGCGDGGSTAGASAEPGKSGSPASSAQAKSSGSPASSGKAAAGGASSGSPDAKPAAAAGGDLLKSMPKDCDEGRVYVNVGKLITGDVGTAFESMMAKSMAQAKDAKKAEEAVKTLKDGGIDPIKSLQEVAVCANKDDKKTIVAVAMDMTKADKPADVLAKTIEQASGKAPKKEEAGDITYLSEDGGKSVIAVVGKTKLVIGEDKAAVEAAAKGADGAGEFGDATSNVIWAKIAGNKQTDVTMKEAGANYDLKVSTKTGPDGAKMKDEFEKKVLPEIDKVAEKMPFVKPLLPAVKNAKLEVAGDMLNVSTSFPKAAIGEFLNTIKDMKPEDLMKMGRF